MNTTPEQLRLAADLIEKKQPYQYGSQHGGTWVDRDDWSRLFEIWNDGFIIRPKPASFPPIPEGMSYHNPDGLTAEQVGDGWRLLVIGEVMIAGYQCWSIYANPPAWRAYNSFTGERVPERNGTCSVRVPISTPYPDGSFVKDGVLVKPWTLTRHIPGFRPLRDGEEWHSCGDHPWNESDLREGWRPCLVGEEPKKGDHYWLSGDGPFVTVEEDWGKVLCKGLTCARTTRPLPEPPKLVPLGPSDVPPGSAIGGGEPGIWRMVTAVDSQRVFISASVRPSITYKELMDEGKRILRPGQTDWHPCSKTS